LRQRIRAFRPSRGLAVGSSYPGETWAVLVCFTPTSATVTH
jgi:hypothetical protein